MLRRVTAIFMTTGLAGAILWIGCAPPPPPPAQEAPQAELSFAAIPGEKGGQDQTGPYEVVKDWPKPMSASLPGHEQWGWSAAQGVFAESPNRVYVLQRGELPVVERPAQAPVPQFGPSLSFPVNAVPFRNASQGPASALGPIAGRPDNWKGRVGVDARWEHVMLVLDAEGNIVESWTQWDKMFTRPHAVYVNPYDPDKNVWVVDDGGHAVYKFSHDGKELLQTLGTHNESGNDATHFNRPTFLAWLPDSTLFVSDGYGNTRVAKFDKDGNYLMEWGQPSLPVLDDTRPGYFNTVHGVVVDPDTRRVYVDDRGNHRIQVFDENGTFIDQWSTGDPSSVYSIFMSADRHIWGPDNVTSKFVKYDLEGHFLYSWGSLGNWPGSLFCGHQMSVDQEGNLYIAEVCNGRVQKFRPREGVRPELLIGQPFRSAAWQ